jgi:hypothetical protein
MTMDHFESLFLARSSKHIHSSILGHSFREEWPLALFWGIQGSKFLHIESQRAKRGGVSTGRGETSSLVSQFQHPPVGQP